MTEKRLSHGDLNKAKEAIEILGRLVSHTVTSSYSLESIQDNSKNGKLPVRTVTGAIEPMCFFYHSNL